MQSLEIRAQKGMEIAGNIGQVTRLDDTTYKVASQSSRAIYEIVSTEKGWTCQCPDHTFRGVKCKHIWAVEFSFAVRKQVQQEIVLEPITVNTCLRCKSNKIKKAGLRKNKYGAIQKFYCKSCGYWFTINLGFERMKHNPQAITSAMQLYFGGESLRHTQDSLRLLGTQVSYQTVHNWIRKYVSTMAKYVDKLQPQVGNAWRTDELFVKVRGNMKYLFALMDDETRYWIAQEVADHKGISDVKPMFQEARKIAGKSPRSLTSDGAQNFIDAFRAFHSLRNPKGSVHIRQIRIDGQVHNNKMERMNGEVRDREKVVRGVKSVDSPIFKGNQIYHNFIRPHLALNGKTPADLAGIKVNGENKWMTLIQNASRAKENLD